MREQTTLLVVSQYLAALRAGEQVKTVQSRVDLALALANQAQQLEENGIGTNLDTVRANVELQNARQALLVAQADSQKALYGLARLLDLDPRQANSVGGSVLLLRHTGIPGRRQRFRRVGKPAGATVAPVAGSCGAN